MTVVRAADVETPSGSRPSALLCGAVVAAYIGVSILRPGLPSNLAFVDPIILGVCFVALMAMWRAGSPATRGAVKALPWIWLILLGSFLGLATVGITGWAISNLSRTLFALLTFFCFWHLLYQAKLERFAKYGTAVGLALTSFTLLTEQFKYRARAYFEHPNYAGHYAALAAATLIVMCRTWWAKVLAAVGLGIALYQTSSFGAIAMVLVMLAVLAFRSLTRSTAFLAVGLLVLVIGAIYLSTPASEGVTDSANWSLKPTLNQDRFDRSQGSRAQLWGQAMTAFAQSPLGVGPDGVHQRGIGQYRGVALEIHSDALGYLVERGVIGLVGFIGLWFTIWKLSKPGGFARLLILPVLVAGIFRETMHYRHMWLFLALAFVYDQRRADESLPRAAEPIGDHTDDGPAPVAAS